MGPWRSLEEPGGASEERASKEAVVLADQALGLAVCGLSMRDKVATQYLVAESPREQLPL